MSLCHVLPNFKPTYATSKITTSPNVEYLEVEYIARRQLLVNLAFSECVDQLFNNPVSPLGWKCHLHDLILNNLPTKSVPGANVHQCQLILRQ
jgi:hypothetical protein